MSRSTSDIFLEEAIEEAKRGLAEGGIPIGSVLVIDGQIVGRGHNKRVQKGVLYSMQRWMHWRTQDAFPRAIIGEQSCTQPFPRATCARELRSCIEFLVSSSVKIERSKAPKRTCAPVVS